MRVLVTGAAGFAGRWLVRELTAAGHEVVGCGLEDAPPRDAPRGVRWTRLDVTSSPSIREVMRRVAPEGVVHLAGQASVGASFGDPLATWEVNATGTLRVASELQAGCRMVVVSSAEVYGMVPEPEQPIREGRPLEPTNPYAASKAAAEMAALQVGAQGRAEVVVARSFNHTGPGQDARFALASFARQLAAIRRGEADPVLRVGNLSARRDLLDVRDVVRAYRCLLERGAPGERYNVASGEARSIREVVEAMVELSGTGAEVVVDPSRVRPVDVPLLSGHVGKLRSLGWAPEIPFRETLRALLDAA